MATAESKFSVVDAPAVQSGGWKQSFLEAVDSLPKGKAIEIELNGVKVTTMRARIYEALCRRRLTARTIVSADRLSLIVCAIQKKEPR